MRRADGAGGRIGDGVDELLDIAPGDVGHLAFRSAERDALLIALSSNPGGLNVKTAGTENLHVSALTGRGQGFNPSGAYPRLIFAPVFGESREPSSRRLRSSID